MMGSIRRCGNLSWRLLQSPIVYLELGLIMIDLAIYSNTYLMID